MLLKLAWSSVWHRKTRAILSILAVAIGIAMMVTMLALAHGTLGEVADRMTNVDADLLVLPSQTTLVAGGAEFKDKHGQVIEQVTYQGQPVVQQAIAVLWQPIRMAGKEQRMFGIDPADMASFLGTRKLLEGRLPDADGSFRRMLDALRRPSGLYDVTAVTPAQLAAGCELLIDKRLAVAGKYKVGDEVGALGQTWRIVGIVEPGVAAWAFCPIQTLRHISQLGELRATVFYVKLRPEVSRDPLELDRIALAISDASKTIVEPLGAIQSMWETTFATMYAYIWVASAVAMTVCFLLICVTMYTMVVERTGQIAIIKAMGGGRWMLLAQSVIEAAILSVAGTAAGITLAMLARWIIEKTMPLLTVEVRAKWFLLAIGVGIIGGTLSALYPGWRAGKVQPALALQNT
jgi:ABC-type lipoprotein release transport system permease subunit